MARAFKDGAGSSYDATNNKFTAVPFGKVLNDPTQPQLGVKDNPTGKFFEVFSFGTNDTEANELAAKANMKKQVDNSNAGNLRDCAECHVGGGMNEYVYANMPTKDYSPTARTSFRDFNFGTAVTAWNYFVDIFNTDTAKRGEVVKQNYSETGVLEMDCLMCHQTGYSWEGRKHAVQKGEFDASRPAGAGLINGIANGLSVFYNYTAVKTNASGKLYVDLSDSLNGKPKSDNCAACHHTRFNVEWKKRGEQWLRGSEVHYGMGCMACHERKDKDANGVPTNVGTTGTMADTKLGLCDPAKGGASDYEAMWNKLDTVSFKECSDCHEPKDAVTKQDIVPTWPTYGAPFSVSAHAAKGLTAKIAFDKKGDPISHIDLIDCTSCHLYKDYEGGTMIDGTGADAEGRVALHDEAQMGRDNAGTKGNGLYWGANGKLYTTGLSTSAFVRDMNGMDTANGGVDGNNDGRTAGMDTLLQTHVNDINIAAGAVGLSKTQNADGSWVNESEVTDLFARITGGKKADGTTSTTTNLKTLLGIDQASVVIPKLSWLMVPFKSSHSIARTVTHAWGKNGCADCHGADKGFYNGAYPVKGEQGGDIAGVFNYRFKSNQATTYTKVNGFSDTTDSHPSLITKKGDRSVPVQVVSKFDGPYVANKNAVANQTLRSIDRSETIYENTFQTRDTSWKTVIAGTAPAAPCGTDKTSPFFCATPIKLADGEGVDDAAKQADIDKQNAIKSKATSTKGWVLRVEIKDDTAPGKVRFRTAQLGKDNATTMTEVLAALPASFLSNDDFTVTEAPAGAVTITAVNGHEIRLAPNSDVAPFGLKGQLWLNEKITRNGVDIVEAGKTVTTRKAFVDYLNAVPTDLASYGIGVNPVAAMARIDDISAVQLGTQVEVAKPVALSALAAQTGGTVSYEWSALKPGTCTDAFGVVSDCLVKDDVAPIDAVFTTATAQTATVTFGSTGNKIIQLTVKDEEGKTSTVTADVTAINAPMTIAWAPGAGFSGVATFSGLPAATTKVKVTWGDGTLTQKIDAAAKPEIPATYYLDGITVKTPLVPAVPAFDAVDATGIVAYSHTYTTGTAKNIKLYCYDVDGLQIGYQQINILP